MPGPVEWADPKTIAGQDQAALPAVPEGDGVLPVQMLEHGVAVFFPEMWEEFGIAMGAEAMPLLFELFALFGIVEKLAVEDDGNRAVFIRDWLPTVEEADNAEPAIGERYAVLLEVAVFIGAAMHDGVGHGVQHVLGNEPIPRRSVNAPAIPHMCRTRPLDGASPRQFT